MEYDFLFDPARQLLAIGYNVGEGRRDASYYDLLASEARACQLRRRSRRASCRRTAGSPSGAC